MCQAYRKRSFGNADYSETMLIKSSQNHIFNLAEKGEHLRLDCCSDTYFYFLLMLCLLFFCLLVCLVCDYISFLLHFCISSIMRFKTFRQVLISQSLERRSV